jgi:uncharacterized protein (UPF0335 family)
MATRKPKPNRGAAQELKDIVERIVALQIEKKGAMKEYDEDIDDIYTEADGKGYDIKALKLAVRRRHESAEARAKRLETEALADLYAAAIGDLSGKPLDELTRRRIDEQMRKQQGEQEPAEESAQQDLPEAATEPAEPPETPEQAKDKGKQARKDGKRIVDNPYHSSSPLRAMWDEGWCEEDGSDGMEIPEAWRRTKPPEEKGEGGGEGGGEGDGGEGAAPPPPPGDANQQQHQQA